MPSWFDRSFSSSQLPIILSAVVSGVTVASIILSVQAFRQKVATRQALRASATRSDHNHVSHSTTESRQNNEGNQVAKLAVQAQNGDYDPGMYDFCWTSVVLLLK